MFFEGVQQTLDLDQFSESAPGLLYLMPANRLSPTPHSLTIFEI